MQLGIVSMWNTALANTVASDHPTCMYLLWYTHQPYICVSICCADEGTLMLSVCLSLTCVGLCDQVVDKGIDRVLWYE